MGGVCISFLFKGSIIILQNYGEAKLSEGLMSGGWKHINRSGKRCLLFSVGIFFFFLLGTTKKSKVKGPFDLPVSLFFSISGIVFFSC